MYGSVTCDFLGRRRGRGGAGQRENEDGKGRRSRQSPVPPAACIDVHHCVLHAPVSGSAGVNMLLAAELNSSWPCGIGRLIQ